MYDYFMVFNRKLQTNFFDMFAPLAQGLNASEMTTVQNELKYFFNCEGCKLLITQFKEWELDAKNQRVLDTFLARACNTYLTYPYPICISMVNIYGDLIRSHIYEIVVNENIICNYFIPVCNSYVLRALTYDDYIQDVLKDKPAFIQDDAYLDNMYKKHSNDELYLDTYTILQLSDWHVDFRYKEGASTACKEEICCQERHGMPEDPKL